ncbi:MAG: SH3 domain-containing protein [Pseudomonadales bacterium]|nr:SH3 domain-containing protein [Pseudomonadales bacterium]
MQATKFIFRLLAPLICIAFLTGAGLFKSDVKKGGGGTNVTDLTKCGKAIGTAALVESELPSYHHYGLSSPIPLVKLMMARSGCFKVVSRGSTSAALKAERAMAKDGDFAKGSNMGGGQMAAADFVIVAQIIHQDSNAGGGGAGLGGLLPGRVGAVAGMFKKKKLEAQVMLTVTNVRTSVQEAISEGSATKSDLKIGGFGWIGGVAGGGGTYESTDIGKITATAFVDAHNNLVSQLGVVSAANVDNAGYVTAANVEFRAGPSSKAPSMSTLYEGTSIIPTGTKNGSWWEVEALGKTGWVHSDYITR